MESYATIDDITTLFRELRADEVDKATALLPLVSNCLRYEANKVSKDLDSMILDNPYLADVAKSVTVDVVARTLNTSTDAEPMSQVSQSAGGYSVSGTYLIPGGGLFIKKNELARLGLRRQRYGAIEAYGNFDKGDNCTAAGES